MPAFAGMTESFGRVSLLLQPCGGGEVGLGVGVVALVLVGEAAVGEEVGVARAQADRLVVVADGAVGILLLAPGIAAIVPGLRHRRIGADRLAVVPDRAVDLAFGAPLHPAASVSVGE